MKTIKLYGKIGSVKQMLVDDDAIKALEIFKKSYNNENKEN